MNNEEPIKLISLIASSLRLLYQMPQIEKVDSYPINCKDVIA